MNFFIRFILFVIRFLFDTKMSVLEVNALVNILPILVYIAQILSCGFHGWSVFAEHSSVFIVIYVLILPI